MYFSISLLRSLTFCVENSIVSNSKNMKHVSKDFPPFYHHRHPCQANYLDLYILWNKIMKYSIYISEKNVILF